MNVRYLIFPHFFFFSCEHGVGFMMESHVWRYAACYVWWKGKEKGQLFLQTSSRIVYFGYYLHQKMKIHMMLETTLLISICIRIRIFQPHLHSLLPSQLTFPFSNPKTLVDILPSTHPCGYTLEQRLTFTIILLVIRWSAFLRPSLFLRFAGLNSISCYRSLMILLTPINPTFQPVDRSPETFALY